MRRVVRGMLYPVVMAAAILAIASAGAWLCGTPGGARWLLDVVSRHTPLTITARTVEGSLSDRLLLTGVRVAVPLREAEIDSLELHWRPLLLLGGQIGVHELDLTGVRIRDHAPASKEPPTLSWPRLPDTARMLDVSIARLRVNGFSYQRTGEKPVALDTVVASVDWLDGLLSLNRLQVASPDGRVTGTIVAGLHRPSLTTDLAIVLPHPLADMDRFTLHARLLPGRDPEQAAGKVELSAAKGQHRRLGLGGEMGVTRHGLNLRRLSLEREGMRGRITGDGSLTLTEREPLLKLRVALAALDLAPELGVATDLTGEAWFEGGATAYRGGFDLANRGAEWRTARLSGGYRGDRQGMRLDSLRGSLLGGTASGNLEIGWEKGLALRGSISARGLDPARIAPEWKGVVNADLDGSLTLPPHAPPRWDLAATLLESSLHGQPLTGEVRAASDGGALRIDRLALHGKGFDLDAHGTPDQRLTVQAQVSDLSRLLPGTAGELRADGRIRWRDGRLTGDLSGSGSGLQGFGVRVAAADLTARLGDGTGRPLHIVAGLRGVSYRRARADSISFTADGTLANHTLEGALRSGAAGVQVALSGTYGSGGWQGRLIRLSGHDAVGPWKLTAPAPLTIGSQGITIAPLAINGGQGESITLSAGVTRSPLGGSVRARWNGLNLARANQWLEGIRVGGTGDGSLLLDLTPQERLTVAVNAGVQGTFATEGHTIDIRRGHVLLDAGEHGWRAGADLTLADGGQLNGAFSSASPARPARPALPGGGSMTVAWSGIDPALLRPWLPANLDVGGKLSGRAKGTLLAGQRLELDGSIALSPATVRLRAPGGEVGGEVRNAAVAWSWRGDTLRGTASMQLAEYGQVRGIFQLPLPARLPVAIVPRGPLRATLTGHFSEHGALTALFPTVVRESKGEVDAALDVTGTWQEPLMSGSVHLARAGAYLPAAGVHVTGVRLDARLEKDLIRIDSFRADSGPGHLEGTAQVRLNGWRVAGYAGTLTGDRFQTMNLPEIRMLATPHLTFEGTTDKLAVRGEINLPELIVQGPPLSNVVEPSKDVIIEGAPPAAVAPPFPIALDIRVRVTAGDRVQVKLEGIDAQLGGSIDLTILGLDRITSSGSIKVVKGRYKAYGIDLEIVRGQVHYTGGSIGRPTIDVLALRTVGDVRAGVTVTGPIQAPLVKLYAEPAMADADTLAYIVLGHPLEAGSSQVGLVAQAAGLLLSSSDSASLKDQIQEKLGLSTLGVETQGATSTYSGYKVVQVAPPGTTTTQDTGLSQSMATVGKYLTPQLYVSYGRAIFGDTNLIRLRYDISRRWQIETQSGTESGADLYYKIEFR